MTKVMHQNEECGSGCHAAFRKLNGLYCSYRGPRCPDLREGQATKESIEAKQDTRMDSKEQEWAKHEPRKNQAEQDQNRTKAPLG